MSSILHGEQGALALSASLCHILKDPGAQEYAANQTRKYSPNALLFARDRHLCGYCGERFMTRELSRDHVKPVARGGRDSWTNTVTACRRCNTRKGSRSPEQAGMPLLYVPYVPDRHEHFILRNRRILADQMEYLLASVSRNSRLHRELNGAHAGEQPILQRL